MVFNCTFNPQMVDFLKFWSKKMWILKNWDQKCKNLQNWGNKKGAWIKFAKNEQYGE